MSAVVIVTLILVALLVAALAFYLLWVIVILRSANSTLGKVTFGVRAIAHRTEPLASLLHPVNRDLGEIAEALEGVVAQLGDGRSAAAS